MLISVVVPIYNMEKYLERCVNSLLTQTYPNIEIILVNDGSTDKTAEICDEFAKTDNRIKVIHKENGGVSTARNTGIDNSTGEYISFVDPDDWLEPNAYEILTDTLNKPENQEVDIIRFNAFRGEKIMNKPPFEGIYKGDELRKEIGLASIGPEKLGGLFIMGIVWMDLYKRKFLIDNNIRFVVIRRYEDRLFIVKAFLKAKTILFLNKALYHYEYIEVSMTNKYDPERWKRELDYMETLKAMCKDLSIPLNSVEYRLKNEYLLRAATTLHHEYFSKNPNGFSRKYKKTKEIVTNPFVIDATKDIRKYRHNKKDSLILFLIKHRCAFSLSILEEIIRFKNKKKNG
ncbi:MAG: glycosyltransferase [Dysgonomonas sp.]